MPCVGNRCGHRHGSSGHCCSHSLDVNLNVRDGWIDCVLRRLNPFVMVVCSMVGTGHGPEPLALNPMVIACDGAQICAAVAFPVSVSSRTGGSCPLLLLRAVAPTR